MHPVSEGGGAPTHWCTVTGLDAGAHVKKGVIFMNNFFRSSKFEIFIFSMVFESDNQPCRGYGQSSWAAVCHAEARVVCSLVIVPKDWKLQDGRGQADLPCLWRASWGAVHMHLASSTSSSCLQTADDRPPAKQHQDRHDCNEKTAATQWSNSCRLSQPKHL